MTDIDTLRRAALADCKHPERIAEAAEEAAKALRLGRPVEIALAPSNGTRYCWVLTPVSGCSFVQAGDYLESGSVEEDIGVWVAKVNGYDSDRTVYPVALLGRAQPPDPTYLAEKFYRGNLGFDVFILEALLAEIGKRTALTRVPT